MPETGTRHGVTRLFVAAWPPIAVAERLARLVEGEHVGVRPVPVDHLHVTLRFLGDVDAGAVTERLAQADLIAAVARFGPEVTRLGERQLVVRVDGAEDLATAVRLATEGLGRPSRDEFFGHLTLARVRRDATSPIEGQPVEGCFTLDDIRLVESRLEPTGAVYTNVGWVPVGRRGDTSHR